MLIRVPGLLSVEQVAHCQRRLADAEWLDGRVTAGPLAARAKNNIQLAERSKIAVELGDLVLAALERNPLFISAALPKQVFPPLFNRYDPGMGFKTHVDNAIRTVPGTPHRIRTDLSGTVFLADPESYDGGELVIEDNYGAHRVKLEAGDLILYPASSLHHVTEVTSGSRIAAFFWVQSLVRDDGERTLLFDLDCAIRDLGADHPATVRLTATYHNLLRRWADL
jgi:PKHD-type hydroxylase